MSTSSLVTHVDVKRANFPKRLFSDPIPYDEISGLFFLVLFIVGWPFFYLWWNVTGRHWRVIQWQARDFRFDKVLSQEKFRTKQQAQHRSEQLHRELGI